MATLVLKRTYPSSRLQAEVHNFLLEKFKRAHSKKQTRVVGMKIKKKTKKKTNQQEVWPSKS